MGNPMAKPFHIGSEFILSVVEGIFDILFIFISTLSSVFRFLPSVVYRPSSAICPPSSDFRHLPSDFRLPSSAEHSEVPARRETI